MDYGLNSKYLGVTVFFVWNSDLSRKGAECAKMLQKTYARSPLKGCRPT